MGVVSPFERAELSAPAARVCYAAFAAIYSAVAIRYLAAPPLELHALFAGTFAAGATIFAVIALVLPRLPAQMLEPLVTASVILAEVGAITFLVLTGDPKQSVDLVMVLVAAGAVVPTMRSELIGVSFGVAVWLVAARQLSMPDFQHWLVNILGAAAVSIAVSATRLRALAELHLSRFMTDHANDAIYLLSRDGKLLHANETATTMLGYGLGELRRTPADVIDPSAAVHDWASILLPAAGGKPVVVQTTHRRKSGEPVPIELSLKIATHGGREYACAIARDITERRAVEERLERARVTAEAASRAKSQFLATMSHEIRTPLNGVFGMIDLALEADDDRERREFLLGARCSAESLLALLNQILDHSDLETGALCIAAVDFEPRELGDRVLRRVVADAEERGIDLSLHVDAALPKVVRGDLRRVAQILTNLATNALKFTERGAVEIRLECESLVGESVLLAASVHDTGIGIAAEDLPAIFEPFRQVDSSHARRFGGAGLGLSIARDLARTLGGTIDVSSTPGEGSTFRCRLPLTAVRRHDTASSARL